MEILIIRTTALNPTSFLIGRTLLFHCTHIYAVSVHLKLSVHSLANAGDEAPEDPSDGKDEVSCLEKEAGWLEVIFQTHSIVCKTDHNVPGQTHVSRTKQIGLSYKSLRKLYNSESISKWLTLFFLKKLPKLNLSKSNLNFEAVDF